MLQRCFRSEMMSLPLNLLSLTYEKEGLLMLKGDRKSIVLMYDRFACWVVFCLIFLFNSFYRIIHEFSYHVCIHSCFESLYSITHPFRIILCELCCFFLSEHYFFLFIYRLYKKIINNANILLILDHCASFGFIREKCIICSVQVSFVRDTKQRD